MSERWSGRQRSALPEWMDVQDVSAQDYAACLADLAAVNTVTLARLPTLGFLRQVVRRYPGKVIRVLDVACGEGDMLRRLHRWSLRAGHRLELVGLDLSIQGIAAAKAATPPDVPVTYRVGDAFDPAIGTFDVIISSLFTHHLADAEVVRFLRMMEARTRLGWFVNDLQRHVLAYHGFRALSAAAGWHRFVRHDGPISIARSFRRSDWQALLQSAEVAQVAQLRWHLPFRLCVGRVK